MRSKYFLRRRVLIVVSGMPRLIASVYMVYFLHKANAKIYVSKDSYKQYRFIYGIVISGLHCISVHSWFSATVFKIVKFFYSKVDQSKNSVSCHD